MKGESGNFLRDLMAESILMSDEVAIIRQSSENSWKLLNKVAALTVEFKEGTLALTSFTNLEAGVDYLEDRAAVPLFSHVINGGKVSADDGGWVMGKVVISEIAFHGMMLGKKLEITLCRNQPAAFSVRQVFEIYKGRAGLRMSSFLANPADGKLTVNSSDVFGLNPPDSPHKLYSIEGILYWKESDGGLTNGGRNAMVKYDSDDGWFILPENNWATCLVPGAAKALGRDKLLGIYIWNGEKALRVSTNPAAVQLVLFPHEEVEYFGVNIGVFKGDVQDGRIAAAEHLRRRYKFYKPTHLLSTNDWQWGANDGKRTDSNYRNIVVPKAEAAGFDRINIDDYWYEPEDGVDPKEKWTDMPSLCDFIISRGMKPGHWFSLQGRICIHGWGEGRDCADPANVDFKLKQMREILIGRYHTAWDQVDSGLLWKTDSETPYSHPGDSVYRKILGMRRYMNTIADEQPDLIMQTTCEVDNPEGPGESGNQNIALIHLADNGVIGMFRRTTYNDDIRDLFAAVGMFPLEGMLSTWGEDAWGEKAKVAWHDSPLWYYQFLLARHTSIYSFPGGWPDESVAHMRVFNDWRRNPRIKAVLDEIMRPVYSGPDWMKNEGPWCWMFTDDSRRQALVFAINHLNLNKENAFNARLRWLDENKTYLVQEITQLPGAAFNYSYRGEFAGSLLNHEGLPINLDSGKERCAAFWIQEKKADKVQVLYADAAVRSYSEKESDAGLSVQVKGAGNARAYLIVYKPARKSVEKRSVQLDANGIAIADFDATTVS